MNIYRRLLAMVKPTGSSWWSHGLHDLCLLLDRFAGLSCQTCPRRRFLKKEGVPYGEEHHHPAPPGQRPPQEGYGDASSASIAIILLFLFKGVFEYGQAYLMNLWA